MHKRAHKLFIEDILDSINKIEEYIKGMNYEVFAKNRLVIDAVIRNLEIIGEAAKNIPANERDKTPDIPWRRMVGLRNIAVHEYFGVDLSIVWRIITKNLPETKPKIEKMLKECHD